MLKNILLKINVYRNDETIIRLTKLYTRMDPSFKFKIEKEKIRRTFESTEDLSQPMIRSFFN